MRRIIQYCVRNKKTDKKMDKKTHSTRISTMKHMVLLSLLAVFSVVFLQSCQDSYCVLPSGDNVYNAPAGMLTSCDTLEATYFDDDIHLSSFQYKYDESDESKQSKLYETDLNKDIFRIKVSDAPENMVTSDATEDKVTVTIEYSTVFIVPIQSGVEEVKVRVMNNHHLDKEVTADGYVKANLGLSDLDSFFVDGSGNTLESAPESGSSIKLHITVVKKGKTVNNIVEPDVVLSRFFFLTWIDPAPTETASPSL